jgi:hypothetical protein
MPKTIGYIQGIPVIVPDDWETRTLGPNIINIPNSNAQSLFIAPEVNIAREYAHLFTN